MARTRSLYPRLALAASLVLALAFIFTLPVQALEIDDDGLLAGHETVDDDLFIASNVVVVQGTVNGNLLANGEKVTIDGVVNGDVFIWSAEATVNGTINGNLIAAGQTLTVNGQVRDSLFWGGAVLNLGAQAVVERNLLFVGYELETLPGASIGRDVFMWGAQARLAGAIGRDLQADLNALALNGQIGRDVKLKIAAPNTQINPGIDPSMMFPGGLPSPLPSGLSMTENAVIEGQFNYRSQVDQNDAILGLSADRIVYEPIAVQPQKQSQPHPVQDALTLLAFGALALWQIPAGLQRAVSQVGRPLPSMGRGALILLIGYGGFFLAGLVVLTVGLLFAIASLGELSGAVFGVGLSGIGLTFAIFSLVVAHGSKLVVAFFIGQALFQRLRPGWAGHTFWPLAAGVIIYLLLRAIPILGWLIGFLATLLGLGAIWLAWRKPLFAAAPPAVPAPVDTEQTSPQTPPSTTHP